MSVFPKSLFFREPEKVPGLNRSSYLNTLFKTRKDKLNRTPPLPLNVWVLEQEKSCQMRHFIEQSLFSPQ